MPTPPPGPDLYAMLPWAESLPLDDQHELMEEVAKACRLAASTGRYEVVAEVLEDWHNTAEIWADPELASRLSGAISLP